MADKDWIKSFPPGYRGYAIQIEKGNFQTAELELETGVFKKIGKQCQDVIGLLIKIGKEFQDKPVQHLSVTEIDNIFSQKLQQNPITCKKAVVALAKDSCLATLKSNSIASNLSQEMVGHFIGSYINKEITDKFHNATPKDPQYGEIVNKVKKEIVSPKIKKLQSQVAKKITLRLLNDKSSNQNSADNTNARFNFFDSNRLKGGGYAT